MHNIPTYQTTKKYYNKYLYKITLRIPGVASLRYDKPAVLLEKIKNRISSPRYPSLFWKQHNLDHNDGLRFLHILKEFDGDYGKRIESYSIDVYTNNKDLYDKLSNNLEHVAVHRTEPDVQNQKLYDDINTIVCKNLPHGKYEYKVYLQPHKIPADRETRYSIIQWLAKQCPKITFTDAVQHWLLYTTQNWDRRYILVDNEQTLLMLKLRHSELFGKVYKHVVADK